MYRLRRNTKHRLVRSLCTYLMCRSAHRHGGYVGPGAEFDSPPVLPHGLHGVFISRYAVVCQDIPDGSTVVAPPPRIMERKQRV
nr:hypothetical protein [Flavonifractor plautii]